jgi:hypothetical protein
VYASVVIMIITNTKALNIICASQARSQFKRSWVPDWSVPWLFTSLIVDNIYAFSGAKVKARYHASGDRALMSFLVSRDSTRIKVAGLLWCHILQIVKVSPADTGDSYIDWVRNIQGNLSKDITVRTHQVYGENSDLYEDALIMAIFGAIEYPPILRSSRQWRYFFPRVAEELNGNLNTDLDEDTDADEDIGVDEDAEDPKFELLINTAIAEVVQGRKPFISDRGYCGLVPEHAEEGDCICILFGCDVPVVLRKCNDFYVFIGECYVNGLMDGEAIKAEEAGEIKSQIFEIG